MPIYLLRIDSTMQKIKDHLSLNLSITDKLISLNVILFIPQSICPSAFCFLSLQLLIYHPTPSAMNSFIISHQIWHKDIGFH